MSHEINLKILIGLFTYRDVVNNYGHYIGDVSLGTLTDRCKKLDINKEYCVQWCLDNGISYDNFTSYLVDYSGKQTRFTAISNRVGDLSRFRWYYSKTDYWTIMERYGIDYDEFRFLCRKFDCTGRYKWDRINTTALAKGHIEMDDESFLKKFGIDRNSDKVEKYVKKYRNKKSKYKKEYLVRQKSVNEG